MKKVLLVTSILALAMTANAAIVINEYLYDPDTGTDAGEFIELYNNGGAAVDISGYVVQHVNGGTGTVVAPPGSITIPAATILAAGDYWVIGNSATALSTAYPGVVDQNANLDNILQNGQPDAIVLKDASLVLLDAVNYEGDGAFLVGAETANAISEGGTGRTNSRAVTLGNVGAQVSSGRLPNGVDTNSNENDFANIAATPGAANVDSVSLPFSDNFSVVNPAYRYGFVPVRVVDPTAVNKPGAFSPDGGNVLEVGDATGGGDANFLPAALSKVNVEGYIWIPADNANPWSIGIGIGERSNLNWFSPSQGNGLENGYYLEYQNGPVVSNKASIPAVATASARLIAVDSTPTLNTGLTTGAVGTVLGSTTLVNKGAWNTFQVGMDTGRVYASINGTLIYDGVQVAGSSTNGGIYFGFCERHAGNPDPLAAEFLYLDGIVINTSVPVASVGDWTVMNE